MSYGGLEITVALKVIVTLSLSFKFLFIFTPFVILSSEEIPFIVVLPSTN